MHRFYLYGSVYTGALVARKERALSDIEWSLEEIDVGRHLPQVFTLNDVKVRKGKNDM